MSQNWTFLHARRLECFRLDPRTEIAVSMLRHVVEGRANLFPLEKVA